VWWLFVYIFISYGLKILENIGKTKLFSLHLKVIGQIRIWILFWSQCSQKVLQLQAWFIFLCRLWKRNLCYSNYIEILITDHVSKENFLIGINLFFNVFLKMTWMFNMEILLWNVALKCLPLKNNVICSAMWRIVIIIK